MEIKNNNTPSVFSLIAGILSGILTFFVLIILIGLIVYDKFLSNAFVLILFYFLFLLIVTLSFFFASNQMKHKKTYKKGSILALIFGILSFNIFGIISGAMGLSENFKPLNS